MSTPAVTPRAAASRTRLLAAARDELIAGDGHLEVAALAERAGVSVGLLYRYFGSKAGLIAAVVEDFYDRFEAEALDFDLLGLGDWAARERRRLELCADFYYGDPLAPVLLTRLAREPSVTAVEADRLARHVAEAARNLRHGQRSGELPADLDPEIAGAMILGGLTQVFAQVLARARRPAKRVVVEELWRFVTAAVRYEPAREPS